eukprot:GCRY01002795.1.p1 GENE.GCRY01002795.1~~GCRY01002795.1.p1  ORF type:complete len:478 (+),score=106.33 GCRY01002795.1:265-1698(+)
MSEDVPPRRSFSFRRKKDKNPPLPGKVMLLGKPAPGFLLSDTIGRRSFSNRNSVSNASALTEDFADASLTDVQAVDTPSMPADKKKVMKGPQQQFSPHAEPVTAHNLSSQDQEEDISSSEGRPAPEKALVSPHTERRTREIIENEESKRKHKQIEELLNDASFDIDRLRQLSWGGLSPDQRPAVWKLLMGYVPKVRSRREDTLQKKRQEYRGCVGMHVDMDPEIRSSAERAILVQIRKDLPRTNPEYPVFQHPEIQNSLERVLFIWSVRHPASGYVQGMNDLATPLFLAFLSEHTAVSEDGREVDLLALTAAQLQQVEADSYWCLTRLLAGIQDNYTSALPGIQRNVSLLEELTRKIDCDLHTHILSHDIQFLHFAFRWMNCLLLREFPMRLVFRMWDAYWAEKEAAFKTFHVFVCVALLKKFSPQLRGLDNFPDLLHFLQNLPTLTWTEREMSELLAEAYVLKNIFSDALSHLKAT